ncbi:hypothetical protein HW555_006008 [Spodoptera exigua]|uniref:Uncharacterized protein n=1 Tax=Spodoptera exigua TaxID=7107 RepID=A0A835GHE2_SPOEX|nr:hypothetical protein HW555_006008 [Spodoptera exigua]
MPFLNLWLYFTAAPFGGLGSTPASTAPSLFGGTGFGSTAAKPATGFGNTSFGTSTFGTTPAFGQSTFGSTAPTFGTNTLGSNTFGAPFGGATNTFNSGFGAKPGTGFTGFGNLGAAPQFGQVQKFCLSSFHMIMGDFIEESLLT